MEKGSSHLSIFVKEFLDFFDQRPIRYFIDGTVGAGGHSKVILEAHPEIEKLFGIDQDNDALKIASETLDPFSGRFELIHGNFRNMDRLIPCNGIDGIFLDLGVSSMQLDRPEKGFSFYREGPLDMRMDDTERLDAREVINTFSERKLGEIFRDFGEERRWKAAAKAIVEARRKKKIETTLELCEALKSVLTWGGRGGKKIHPMTLVFQGLRIYVNDELGGIQEGIPKAIELLAPGGRLGVISFHSLEDRIVKQTFRQFSDQKVVRLLTKKPLEVSHEEAKRNPRSRSAKLRFLEKI